MCQKMVGGACMIGQSQDRRARRSRKLLKQGLMELMREKKFSDISVRDITERMDLNRGTFYLHYPDTTALLRSLENDMLEDAQTMIDEHLPETNPGTLRPVFEPILDYIVANKDACTAILINNSTSDFVDRLHQLIYRNGVSLVRKYFHVESDEQMEGLLDFITYGLIGLIKEWFDTEMKLPKQALLQMADRLVTGAASGLLDTE